MSEISRTDPARVLAGGISYKSRAESQVLFGRILRNGSLALLSPRKTDLSTNLPPEFPKMRGYQVPVQRLVEAGHI